MLTNKYRPFNFEGIKGQHSTIKDLQKRYFDKNFPTVMMMMGESGTGKTTVANIVAGLLNCHAPVEKGETAQPCGECKACRDIKLGKYSRDVKFYDGSELSKETIDELGDESRYDPIYDKNKIIIIDEAQNITKGGMEKTLKLLETDRDNIYFILCTMNPEALHKAVRSRGQVYNFHPLTLEEMADNLMDIIELEDPDEKLPDTLIEEGLVAIAETAQGSMRQAVANLERCINAEIYSRENIEKEFGVVTNQSSISVFKKLLEKDGSVFKDLQNTDLKKFFYYAWKVLNNVGMVEHCEEAVGSDWLIKEAKAIRKYESFWKLYGIFEDTQKSMNGYFNDAVFVTNVIKFFNFEEGRAVQGKITPAPEKRKVRRIKR